MLVSFSLLIIPVYAPQESNTVRLFPTDDTFVVGDFTDPDDPKGLQKKPLGYLDVMTTWYVWNFSAEKRVFAAVYLKFDLNDISSDEIESATLLLHASKVRTDTFSPTVVIYALDDTAWSEKDLIYDDGVIVQEKISDTTRIEQPGMYEWDITQYVIDNADSEIAIAARFDTIVDTGSERISFISKDSPSSNYYPTLVIKTQSEKDVQRNIEIAELEKQIAELKQSQTIEDEDLTSTDSDFNVVNITPTDDTFIGLDRTNLNDPLDLRNLNSGDLDFLKIWYANNVSPAQEFIVTSGLLKFDLSELNTDDIISANLKMKTALVYSTGADKVISIKKLNNTNWDESKITYNSRPVFSSQDPVISEITEPDVWYMWDITTMVKENPDSKLSLSVSYETVSKDHEEIIGFYSKESDFPPSLEITLKQQEGGGCLIATATYGTELAPQVQQLRELRDNTLLQTNSGTAFMESFNEFYYSFSPYIANYERENPAFKETVKLVITPMISSLSILNYVDIDSEQEMLGYGIGIILLNIGMYVGIPASVIMRFRK